MDQGKPWKSAKLWVAFVAITVMVAGCAIVDAARVLVGQVQAKYPDAKVTLEDKDGDGHKDTVMVTHPDGRVEEDEAASQALAQAGAADSLFGQTLEQWGLMFGIPVVGLVGRWWGRRKPIQDLAASRAEMAIEQGMITNLVESVQATRKVLSAESLAIADAALKDAQSTEARKRILDVKAANDIASVKVSIVVDGDMALTETAVAASAASMMPPADGG